MRSTSVLLMLFLAACAPVPVNRSASVGSEAEDASVKPDKAPSSVELDGPVRAPVDAVKPSVTIDADLPSPDLAPSPPVDKPPAPVLSNLVVKDTANMAKWTLQKNLHTGDLAFGDRTYMFASVSDSMMGRPWIRPANLSKTYGMDPLATFDVDAPALVMVGVDTRAPMPAWLMDWDATTDQVTYVDVKNATVTHKILTKRFPAGTVSLGPIACPTQDCNSYLIVVGPP